FFFFFFFFFFYYYYKLFLPIHNNNNNNNKYMYVYVYLLLLFLLSLPQDQSSVEDGRSDILHWDSDELKENIALVGMLKVELFVTSTALDTDFTAKLIDIFPNGTPMLVQDGILRLKWRNGNFSTEMAPPLVAGQVYQITVDIGMMSYIFNSKHKIRLSISSSNWPRFSVNWNNDKLVIDGSSGAVLAGNVVGWGRLYPSKLILPQVDLTWIKKRKLKL
ncbi:hypothetical protein RFI_20804, partial [Reticulomyxa filosa]